MKLSRDKVMIKAIIMRDISELNKIWDYEFMARYKYDSSYEDIIDECFGELVEEGKLFETL